MLLRILRSSTKVCTVYRINIGKRFSFVMSYPFKKKLFIYMYLFIYLFIYLLFIYFFFFFFLGGGGVSVCITYLKVFLWLFT